MTVLLDACGKEGSASRRRWLNTIDVAGTVPQVSADGLHAVGTADDGNMVYTWSFTSTPGQ